MIHNQIIKLAIPTKSQNEDSVTNNSYRLPRCAHSLESAGMLILPIVLSLC